MAEPGQTQVVDAEALAASLVGERTADESLAHARGAGDEHVEVLAHPLAGGELGDEGFVEAAGAAVVEVLERRALSQPRALETRLEALVLACGELAVDEQSEAFLEVEALGLGHLALLVQGLGHAEEAQLVELLERGMGEHGGFSSRGLSGSTRGRGCCRG